MDTLLIATTNAGKAREFREMLGERELAWKTLADYPPGEEVEETGATFEENARLKASTYAKRHATWTVADDSGLEVDALDKAPGVLSARWAQHHNAGRGDADNNAIVLRQLAEVPDDRRTGRFVCVLALSDPLGTIVLTVRDTVEGHILRAPRGTNGFGYDPLFVARGMDRTSAELSPGEKHAISHRGKALRQLKQRMIEMKLLPASNG